MADEKAQKPFVELNKLILGRSQYGKSTIAKIFCAAFTAAKRDTFVLDTTGDAWPAKEQTDDPRVFVDAFWETPGLICFIEAGELSVAQHRQFDGELELISKKGRHNFSHSYFLAHRLTNIDTTTRIQCPELFLFSSSVSDSRDLADEYGTEELRDAPRLAIGEFYHVAPGAACTKHRIDFEKRVFVPIKDDE